MTELVSISMLAYNHAPWIEQAIMSIVNQKTEYPFRLYVHDDASTDGTAEIIQRLAEKYPDKITAILQKENQYSKGVNITQGIIRPKMKGEYIALCEGDDYWVDEYKLQKQVSYMESHPDCSLCFSDAMVVDTNGNKIRNFFDNRSWNDKKINAKLKQKGGADFSVEEMLLLDFTPTASLMCSKNAYDELKQFSLSLDLLVRLVTASMGYAHFHNEVFSAYRTGNASSASGSIQKTYEKLKTSFYDTHCRILNEFDDYTGHRYTETIHHVMKRKEIDLLFNSGKEYYKKILKHECYKELTAKKRMKVLAKLYFEKPVRVYKRLKYKNDFLAKM